MAYHDDAHAACCQAPYDPGKRLFELRVKSLRRLVEEQDLGLPQKDLAKCRPLLLAAGKIVGVPVQKLCQLAELCLLKRQRLALVLRLIV